MNSKAIHEAQVDRLQGALKERGRRKDLIVEADRLADVCKAREKSEARDA